MKFADLKNKHNGCTGLIIGTGATVDTLPIVDMVSDRNVVQVRMNRALGVGPFAEGRTYWLVQDHAWNDCAFGPWRRWLNDIMALQPGKITGVFMDPMLGKTRHPAPRGENIVTFNGPPYSDVKNMIELLEHDRERLAKDERLYSFCGTACIAVHLLWFMGITDIIMVGCDGDNTVSEILRPYYPPEYVPAANHGMSRKCAVEAARMLGVKLDTWDGDKLKSEVTQ